jgi:uncharacterized protein
MILGMEKNQNNVVLDTNILVSAVVFDGKPAKILTLALNKQIIGFISKPLLSELQEIFLKKFDFSNERVKQIEKMLLDSFELVYPKKQIFLARDIDDNRVLETAIEGNCKYIITGDNDLLEIKECRNISILTPAEFLSFIQG